MYQLLIVDGEEAVRIIGEKHPDVVLSDIRMPKMDGIELMQYLHENNPEIKIIILSGYNDVEYLNMAIRNQVTEYLLKPTDIDEFETLFHRLKEKLDEEGIRRRELESLKVSAMQNKELSYAREAADYPVLQQPGDGLGETFLPKPGPEGGRDYHAEGRQRRGAGSHRPLHQRDSGRDRRHIRPGPSGRIERPVQQRGKTA